MDGREVQSGKVGEKLPSSGWGEKAYRIFWCGKGDVYRLLLSVQYRVASQTWPASDSQDVLLLDDLIHYVTGTSLCPFPPSFDHSADDESGKL